MKIERSNILDIANSLGYKAKATGPAHVELSVYLWVPATGSTGAKVPNMNYALTIPQGMEVSGDETGITFTTLEDVNFANTGSAKTDVTVFSLSGTDPDAFLIKNRVLKFLFYSYCNIINNCCLKYFDAGVHVSDNFEAWLKRYNVKYNSKLSVLGITEEENMPQFLKTYPESCNKTEITFFYGGTLTLQFDLMPLLIALKNIDFKCKIILVGDNGTGNRCTQVNNFLRENNFNFKNLGNVSKSVLLKNLGDSDVAIIPMISGGLPKKFFDAIGCFKPILNIGKGGAFNEIEKKGLGWNTNFRTEDIEKILSNLTTKDIIAKIDNIKDNRQHFMERNSIEIIYKELQKI